MCQKLIAVLKQTPKLIAKLNKTIIHEYPELEDLEVTPSVEEQKFKSNKYGYNEVTVKGVNIEDLGLEENAVMDIDALATNTTSYNENLLNKLITKLPEEINTSGWTSTAYMFYNCGNLNTFPQIDTSKVTNMNYMFSGCTNLTETSTLNTDKVTNMSYMFSNCSNLTEIPVLNTSNVTQTNYMFNNCQKIITIPTLDTSNVTDMSSMFIGCTNLLTVPQLNTIVAKSISRMFYACTHLTNFGGLKDLGKAYTQKSNNYSNYKLDLSSCTNLTHESLMNVINNLYDLNLTYDVANGGTLYAQSLQLGTTNLAKLTAEEISICTSKGWSVS